MRTDQQGGGKTQKGIKKKEKNKKPHPSPHNVFSAPRKWEATTTLSAHPSPLAHADIAFAMM